VVGPAALKPDSQADTETGISAGLPIATELRPPLVYDFKTMNVVDSRQLTSPEWVTSGVGPATRGRRGASAEADSHGRVLRSGETTGMVPFDTLDMVSC